MDSHILQKSILPEGCPREVSHKKPLYSHSLYSCTTRTLLLFTPANLRWYKGTLPNGMSVPAKWSAKISVQTDACTELVSSRKKSFYTEVFVSKWESDPFVIELPHRTAFWSVASIYLTFSSSKCDGKRYLNWLPNKRTPGAQPNRLWFWASFLSFI